MDALSEGDPLLTSVVSYTRMIHFVVREVQSACLKLVPSVRKDRVSEFAQNRCINQVDVFCEDPR